MASKAIEITEDNHEALSSQGDLDVDLSDCIGMYLVQGFGVIAHYEIFTKETLDRLYKTGEDLKNNYFEVILKPQEEV